MKWINTKNNHWRWLSFIANGLITGILLNNMKWYYAIAIIIPIIFLNYFDGLWRGFKYKKDEQDRIQNKEIF